VAVSFDPEFQRYYPFYRQSHRSWIELVAWELLYAAQFFSLEFFFRGYWLTATRRALGSQAIFAMVVPYVMIHFGKPFPETLGAIVAGIVLGTLAMRTGSIWSGFLIHVSVAVSMDAASLLQTTGLPRALFPELP
jgi:membrane protease YdiL (CAAX protease family)